MKIVMESTSTIVSLGNIGQARVWEGTDPDGKKVAILVTKIVTVPSTSDAMQALMSRIAVESKPPSPETVKTLDLEGISKL